MGRAKRIAFSVLGAAMVALIGAGFVAAGLSPGERIQATVVEAPAGESGTFVEYMWKGLPQVKALDSDRDLAVGSTVDIAEPSFKTPDTVFEFEAFSIPFVGAGVAFIAIAIGLVVFACLFNPDERSKKKISESAANLVPEPSRYWLFLYEKNTINYVTTSHYSFVMLAGNEVVLGLLRDFTNVTETSLAELAAAHKLKPYVDNVRSGTIKSPYKKAFAEPFMLQSIQAVRITDLVVEIQAQDGVRRAIQVPGGKARGKYQVVQSLLAELLPGVDPVVEIEEKRFGKDKEIFVFQREMMTDKRV